MRRSSRPSRRRLLAALAAGGLGGLAGCSSASSIVGNGAGASTPAATETETATTTRAPDRGGLGDEQGTSIPPSERDTLAEFGFPSTICSAPIQRDIGIRAIVDPTYGEDWDGLAVDEKYLLGREAGSGLPDDSYVIGVRSVDGSRARAYPLSVVWWHEIVNDTLDRPLLVTFCPICQSGMVAERLVSGAATTFGVSGQLWQPPREFTAAAEVDGRVFGASATRGEAELRDSGNLVLYDEATKSYWSQFLAEAICGPVTGQRLTIVPSTVASWREWRADHPETDVLLPPPHSTVM